MDFMLENDIISVSIYKDSDATLEFCLWDHRDEAKPVGFHTILTKRDARNIMQALDKWLSMGSL